jgi:hypothetical protein
MLMASWCLYCAYEDRYVIPVIAREIPGLVFNIVDISTNGGIGIPGPQRPSFSGADNVGGPVNVTQMRRTMRIYESRFGLQDPSIHVFVDPTGIQYWAVSSYPVFLFINTKGILVSRVNGALTEPQMARLVARYLSTPDGVAQ